VSKRGLGLLKSKSRYGEPVQERKLTFAEVRRRGGFAAASLATNSIAFVLEWLRIGSDVRCGCFLP
jgi:hypothetical protein